jgi:hypothetical protein
MGAMLGLAMTTLPVGLSGRFAGPCRYIALVQSLRCVVTSFVALHWAKRQGEFGGVRLPLLLDTPQNFELAAPFAVAIQRHRRHKIANQYGCQ